ncbi:unnamed protein product [Vitrella brassicaformis CCMP3155]|uniref:Uncharacterized protein n=1 Tax=Vitrella brassicaformis (strain CCMP3155) TaxID=1169540 RepID=A0A0G4FXC9_VITBC|nr:unnamed protein product [Vitrella brassicaformis CCMP3155]|mmetsp:Transcript_51139/g.128371  ORF Transcript_51139/g.128371 Transcript_51139/m.128371 type:complete len:201 (-) Transcript_51139:1677-2279(-)|eukprot:CEM20057.1 unnamed protein product [Vitrella brassicaformis CCMP3155]
MMTAAEAYVAVRTIAEVTSELLSRSPASNWEANERYAYLTRCAAETKWTKTTRGNKHQVGYVSSSGVWMPQWMAKMTPTQLKEWIIDDRNRVPDDGIATYPSSPAESSPSPSMASGDPSADAVALQRSLRDGDIGGAMSAVTRLCAARADLEVFIDQAETIRRAKQSMGGTLCELGFPPERVFALVENKDSLDACFAELC